MLRNFVLGLAAATVLLAFAPAPASAATFYVGSGYRHHCWIERQKVVVYRHGRPHVYWRKVRVCR